ncbi:response regulator receiver sensor signal transduction histidine kinase [Novosphingobium sp. Rr 2-17]|uniref:hybrid sensor histidine kinase/response regulator n=1 Tax=Novosphingobium sp. Rr 2-17 TaxID=555793 RepID=UPI000269A53C|nr:hybrid sensor histidine kinase/response regulator [Novosphingobium sp. Rr 2-17]EIZ78519.1 response regulator receiver sensor signal transduction histidine kinase [Novosphingobium sp. Rr 2-17]
MDARKPVYFLLVDDLPANLLALEALLRRDDLVLLKASSGEEALELLLRHDVALALLDVQMPDMDGFELAELMRGNERTCHVPIIFVTAGSTDSQRRFRGYEAGAVDFIQKPIEPDILRSKADVFSDLYRQRQQIAAQRDEIAVAAEALRENDRQKDQFLAVLAHELRNPVAALLSGLDLLRRPSLAHRADEVKGQMERTLFHLSRLVEDLLDVSRVSKGKVSLRQERIELSELVRSAVEASQHNMDAPQHTLTVTAPSEPIWLMVDHTRVAQILSNLLNNAAKYTPAGGRIDLTVALVGGEVEICVSDNGMGIPLEMQPHVFEIFTQIEHHRGRDQGGLGIGLALVKQLVALHGGTISVASDGPGTGSAFTVRLPVDMG